MPAGDPPAGLQAKESLDAGGHWIIPGFISAHSHLWQSAFRGLGSDQTLLGWIDALYKPASSLSPEDMYWFTLDGALDHLQHGITGVFNFNFEARTRGPNPLTADEYDQSGFRAEMDSGIRFVHSMSVGKATELGVKPALWGRAGAGSPESFPGLDEQAAEVEQLSLGDDQRGDGVQQYLPADVDGEAAGRRVSPGQ